MAGNRKPAQIRNLKKPQATRAAFLQHYEQCGRINLACERAGIGQRTHYDWLERDKGYAKQFEKSRKVAIQLLEDEAYRRAVEGIERHHGKQVVREYSDTLLIFLLKGAMPDKYREQYTAQISGTVMHGIEEGLAARIMASRQKRLGNGKRAAPAIEAGDKRPKEQE